MNFRPVGCEYSTVALAGWNPPDGTVASDLGVVFQAHWAALHLQAYRILRDHHLAADAVQEAFLSLWLYRTAFHPERGDVAAFLRTLVHHRSVDLLRRRAAGPPTSSLDEATASRLIDLGRTPEDEATDADQHARVMAAIDSLTPTKREVLLLTYVHGYSGTEIATLLGLPIGTVKSRIRLGKECLRSLLPRESLR